MKFLFLCILAVVTGCAVPATRMVGPNGKTAYSLKCSGYMRDRQDCMVKAGEICPAGFDIVDDNSRVNGAIASQNTLLIAHTEYMMISCK